MANSIEEVTLDLQKQWFNQALTQQKAVYEVTLKMWSRLFAVPRVHRPGPRCQGRHHALRDRLRGRHAPLAPLPPRDPGASTPSRSWSATRWSTAPTSSTCNPTAAWSSSYSPGVIEVYLIDWGVPSAADRSMRLKDYIDGLMKNCVERRPPAAQDAQPPSGRLLHGRHDVDHLHRPPSRAGQDAHHHGGSHRLRRRRRISRW